MKIAVAVLLNAALLVALLPWLRRQWRQARGWARAALALGLGGRLAMGLIHARHLMQDGLLMSEYGQQLTARLWAEPTAALQVLASNQVAVRGQEIVFHGISNTLFFAKILAVLNLASLSNNLVNAIYLSVFCLVGCWQLARAVSQAFPQTPAGAGMLALVVWPSVIYWASGIAKETVILGSGAWLLAVVIELFYRKEPVRRATYWGRIIGLILLGILHFNIRYFFALPLFGALAALAIVGVLQRLGVARSRWAQVAVVVAVLSGGAWVASEVSIIFRVNKFTSQLMYMRTQGVAASAGRIYIDYPDLRPTPESVLRHVPAAIGNALTRPWLGESADRLYIVAGLENAGLLILLAVALLAVGQGKAGHLPFSLVLVLLIQCLALAILLGLSSPNLGTMHRYRSILTPYLLLLLLQNHYVAAGLRRLGLSGERGRSDL